MRDPERIYTPKPDETAGLSLWNQREAAPECARPVATAQMRGGKQAGREAVAPHLTGLRGRVYQGIVAHGPCTREWLADTLGMKKDTVNGRASELLKAGLVRITGYERETGRGLLALPTPEAPNAST